MTDRQGLTVFLDASLSGDPDGDELRFRWDFDYDGAFDTEWSNEPAAAAAFELPGQITSKLRVMDEGGAFAEALLSYGVLDDWAPPPEPPPELRSAEASADAWMADASVLESGPEITAADTATKAEPDPPASKRGGGCSAAGDAAAPFAGCFCCHFLLLMRIGYCKARSSRLNLIT